MSATYTKSETTGIEAALSLLMLPVFMIYGLWVAAYVLRALWAWFAVPLWNATPLTLYSAAAAILIIGFLKPGRALTAKEDAMSAGMYLLHSSFKLSYECAFTLLIGYCLHRWFA